MSKKIKKTIKSDKRHARNKLAVDASERQKLIAEIDGLRREILNNICRSMITDSIKKEQQ